MNRLTTALRELCGEELFTEKWLLAPTRRIGHQWAEQVARSGRPLLNLHVKTIRSMAVDLAAPAMARLGVSVVSPRAASLLIDRVYRLQVGRLGYLSAMEGGTSFAAAFLSTFNALRLAGLDPGGMPRKPFETREKAHDIALLATGYLRLLEELKMVDYGALLSMAVEGLEHAAAEGRIVLIPDDLEMTYLERKLVKALPGDGRAFLPVDLPTGSGEDPGKTATDLQLLRWILKPSDAPPARGDGSVTVWRAFGEVNEIRGVFRRCLSGNISLDDVELLHTDSERYIPLLYESLATLHGTEGSLDPPVTFAEGIPCAYSRPGRALGTWLAWIDAGYPQSLLVKMVREGLLRGGEVDGARRGSGRLAALLQRLPIGFGKERSRRILGERITALEHRLSRSENSVASEEGKGDGTGKRDRHELDGLHLLQRLLDRLLAAVPDGDAAPPGLVTGARLFLKTCSRRVDRLDAFAAERLTEELEEMEHWLEREGDGTAIDVREWLENLPGSTRVLGSGPRPGTLHVDHVHSGGHSGRPHLFIVGLDDGRFPGKDLPDPLLLDSERRGLSRDLPTVFERIREGTARFARLLARQRGKVFLSYSCRDIVDDRELFPSAALLSLYRILTGNSAGSQGEFMEWLPPAESFAPSVPEESLDAQEWWILKLAGKEASWKGRALQALPFPHLSRGRAAEKTRIGGLFTAWDGLVPRAGKDLDPRSKDGPVMSAQRLQTVATCPRRYFFRYGLEIEPPEEFTVDPDQWLDPLSRGSLLHELFERFMAELAALGSPPRPERDHPRLEDLLDELVQDYRHRYPPPGEESFRREVKNLRRTARTFLLEESRYFSKSGSIPLFTESSFGMAAGRDRHTAFDSPEPVPVPLPGGGLIRIRGRIDRIDRVIGSGDRSPPLYRVWDYKTGGSRRYRRDDPHLQGRAIQPWLYTVMVRQRLQETVSPDARVDSFGFFFPGERSSGERISWSADELSDGGKLLELSCRIIGEGIFTATNNAAEDCGRCDYLSVCGDVNLLSLSIDRKLDVTENRTLDPFRRLRRAAEQ